MLTPSSFLADSELVLPDVYLYTPTFPLKLGFKSIYKHFVEPIG